MGLPSLYTIGERENFIQNLLWANRPYQKGSLEERIVQILKKIPDYEVDLSEGVGPRPRGFAYNNYGLTPDKDSLERNGESTVFALEGVSHEIPYSDDSTVHHQLFSDKKDAIFADVVLATTNEMGYQAFIVADGCGRGASAKEAARLAAQVALSVIQNEFKELKGPDTKKVAEVELFAMKKAEDALRKNVERAGATTLTIAVKVSQYLVVTKNGDSEVFIVNPEKERCRIATNMTRATLADTGGHLCSVNPIWENLDSYVLELEDGEVVVGCTDGLTDNLDPMQLGQKPSDFGCESDDWANHPEVRQDAITRKFLEVVTLPPARSLPWILPQDMPPIAANLFSYADWLTQKAKLHLLKGNSLQEEAYKDFPGKLDHTSIVVMY